MNVSHCDRCKQEIGKEKFMKFEIKALYCSNITPGIDVEFCENCTLLFQAFWRREVGHPNTVEVLKKDETNKV